MNLSANHRFIGLTEMVSFPDAEIREVPAKIDTGAYTCAVWATDIKEVESGLSFVLFDKESPHYSGKTILVAEYSMAKIRNSFGHREERYKVKLRMKVGRIIYNTTFTLADRSINRYPVLLGRKLLGKRFVVDVTKNNVHLASQNTKL